MIIDRTHIRWGVFSAVILAISTAAYIVYVRRSLHGPAGGSLPGLIFGIIAALLMLYAFLLAVRRRWPAARLGSGQFWLRGHLWMGALTVPMVLFHSGFGFGGLLEQVLMSLFAVVVVSGVYGLVVQHFVPRLMQHAVPDETFIEQIPFIRRCNLILCDQAVAKQCGSLDIAGDPIRTTLTTLVDHAAKLGREEKDQWLDAVDPEWQGLFRSLARRAKEASWPVIKEDGKIANMRQESDFPLALKFMYALNGASQVAPTVTPVEPAGTSGAASDDTKVVPPAKLSPLQLARKVPAAAKQDTADNTTSESVPTPVTDAAAAVPLSVEAPATTAGTAATDVAKPAAPEKPSPLELARRQAAAKKAAAGGANPVAAAVPAGSPPAANAEAPDAAPTVEPSANVAVEAAPDAAKPAAPANLSPLELARQQAAAKKAAAGGTTPAPPAVPAGSPATAIVEIPPAPSITETTAEADGTAAPKKLSPLELARRSAAAKQKVAATASDAAAPAAAPVEGTAVPAAVAPVRKPGPPAAGGKPSPPVKKPTAVAEPVETVPQQSLERLKQFYLNEGVRDFLQGATLAPATLAATESAQRIFARLRGELPVALHAALEPIERYCDEQRQMLHLKRLHRQLHCWLAVHIPASVAVVVLMIVHIVVALRVVPFSF